MSITDSQEIKRILLKLEQMDQERKNSPIPQKLEEVSGQITSLQLEVHHVSQRADESHKVLLGNHDPDKGLHNRFTLLENQTSRIENKLDRHLQSHKETEKNLKSKLWELTKPFILLILTWIFMGAITYQLFAGRIAEIIQHVQP